MEHGKQVVLFPSQKNIERHPISVSESGSAGESFLVLEWYEDSDQVSVYLEVQEKVAYIGDIPLADKSNFIKALLSLFSNYIINKIRTVKSGDISETEIKDAVRKVKGKKNPGGLIDIETGKPVNLKKGERATA